MKKFIVSIVATLLASIILWSALYLIGTKTNWFDKLKEKTSISKEENVELEEKLTFDSNGEYERFVLANSDFSVNSMFVIGTSNVDASYVDAINSAIDNESTILNSCISKVYKYKVNHTKGDSAFVEFVEEDIAFESCTFKLVDNLTDDYWSYSSIELNTTYTIESNQCNVVFTLVSAIEKIN